MSAAVARQRQSRNVASSELQQGQSAQWGAAGWFTLPSTPWAKPCPRHADAVLRRPVRWRRCRSASARLGACEHDELQPLAAAPPRNNPCLASARPGPALVGTTPAVTAGKASERTKAQVTGKAGFARLLAACRVAASVMSRKSSPNRASERTKSWGQRTGAALLVRPGDAGRFGVPQEYRGEEPRSPIPGWSPFRLILKSVSMNGTLSLGFCNSPKSGGVAYKDVLNTGGRWFPPYSQSVALVTRMSVGGQEMLPGMLRIQQRRGWEIKSHHAATEASAESQQEAETWRHILCVTDRLFPMR